MIITGLKLKISKPALLMLAISILLSSCCGLTCKREKHAKMIIEKVEAYRKVYGTYPTTVTEIGIDDQQDHLSFYEKISPDEYIVWYGIGLGTSRIYHSKSKIWTEEG